MKLIIVESPTKARTLSRFLGPDFKIMASMGHVRDLPKKKLGVDEENNYKPSYEALVDKKKTIKELKSAAVKARAVILATDPDREGEAIAYHVKHLCSGAKFGRITFHEITKDAVLQALNRAGSINMALVHAQQARRVLDRLVGYKLSPLLWRKVRRGLSAGRVQSVTVRLIVERERLIKDFKPEDYWEFYARLFKDKASRFFTAKLVRIDDKKVAVGDKKKANKITAELKKAKYEVVKVAKNEVIKNPPPPFITSSLQRNAANLYRYSARRTMSLAQRLYEAGLITYHRTDSVTLSAQAIKMLRGHIRKEYGANYLPPTARQYKTKAKSAQEAHEAIRPTKLVYKRELKGAESKLFQLIKNRALASQMASAVYDKTTVEVKAGKKYLFRKTAQDLKFDGFLKLWEKADQEIDPEAVVLAKINTKDKLNLKELKTEAKQTQPPGRYTEAGLIRALENRGIGRPSTYAPIITTIQSRQYVEKEEGHFCPTPVGMAVTEFLEKNFPKIMDYEFTAGMEDNLDKVALKEEKWQAVIDDFYKPFAKNLKTVGNKAKRVEIPTEKIGKKCPKCKKGEQVIRVGRFGKFLSCSRFPDCEWKDTYKEVIKGVKCPECGGKILVRQTRAGKRFFGCEKYPKCKWASWRRPKPLN
jgi:DNA topoisomerase-1